MAKFTTDSAGELAAFLGKSERQVKRYIDAGLPRSKKTARKYTYDLSQVHAWVLRQELQAQVDIHVAEIEKLKKQYEQNQEPKSESLLDRQRRLEGDIKEIELRRLKGELVEISVIKEGLAVLESILKSSIETLQRDFGPEVLQVMREAQDEFKDEIRRRFQ